MSSNPTQRIFPYLQYDDAPAAIEFLTGTFGFQEVMRFPMPDGRLGHAEIRLGDAVIMLASAFPEVGLVSPRGLAGIHTHLTVYVDDVDAHFTRAKAGGAQIESEPEDQDYGDRAYRCRDPEGHRWTFSTRLRDVPAEDW